MVSEDEQVKLQHITAGDVIAWQSNTHNEYVTCDMVRGFLILQGKQFIQTKDGSNVPLSAIIGRSRKDVDIMRF